MSICCSKCGICNEGFSPDLCYSNLYTIQPKKFIKVIFKNLLKSKHLIKERHNPYTHSNLKKFFIEVFCSANLCGKYRPLKQCTNINMCLSDLRCQINGYPITNKVTVFNTEIKKNKQRYIVQAYPTFFTNENENFSKEIKKILATGK